MAPVVRDSSPPRRYVEETTPRPSLAKGQTRSRVKPFSVAYVFIIIIIIIIVIRALVVP